MCQKPARSVHPFNRTLTCDRHRPQAIASPALACKRGIVARSLYQSSSTSSVAMDRAGFADLPYSVCGKIPVYPRQGYLPLHFWSKLWTCKILPWHVECRSQRVVNLVRSRSTLSVINCRPSLVELSWQYLRRSTFDWRPWPTMPVCHTERPPLCTARRAWLRLGSASRGSIIGSRRYV